MKSAAAIEPSTRAYFALELRAIRPRASEAIRKRKCDACTATLPSARMLHLLPSEPYRNDVRRPARRPSGCDRPARFRFDKSFSFPGVTGRVPSAPGCVLRRAALRVAEGMIVR